MHMKQSRGLFSWAFFIGFIAILFFAWVNRLEIYDWARLREYEPPQSISRLATDTTMNDDARRLFYVQHPELNNAEEFNRNCGSHGEQTIVLGCYITGRGIFLFDVEDPRLEGVKQVTAAHELLHAAYERLGAEEKSRIDGLISETFSRISNERIISAVESYRKRDPSIVPNELHSIIGTEVRNLPEELETYYGQYFDNRAMIVNYAEEYEEVLTSRRNRSDTLDLQIKAVKEEINQLEVSLAEQRQDLESDRSSVSTQEEAEEFNARVRQYNDGVEYLNTLIARHNELVKEYEENALEYEELYDALSSKPTI